MVTVCAPSHPLASGPEPISREEFGRHTQLVVTDNQAGAQKTQVSVAGERQWLLNDVSAKSDFLKAGLGWVHMPSHLVTEDLVNGALVELKRRAWHIHPLTFVISRCRGHDPSTSEIQLTEMLAATGRF